MPAKIPIIIQSSRFDSRLKNLKEWILNQPEYQYCTSLQKDAQFIINQKGLFLQDGKTSLFFHPSMALLRIINLQRGEEDRYLKATGLKEGDTLLDATLGLAGDALVGSWAVGEKGRVVGLESSPMITILNRYGLKELAQSPLPKVKNQEKKNAWMALKKAATRVEIHWIDHYDYLKRQKDHSFDVVYFDPMFRHTQVKSASIQPLHKWANHDALTPEVIQEACRVARKRVVLKERKGSKEFERLGFTPIPGGTYSQVDYGIILV